jgi:hypothetical protein
MTRRARPAFGRDTRLQAVRCTFQSQRIPCGKGVAKRHCRDCCDLHIAMGLASDRRREERLCLPGYVRYADDRLLFGDDKQQLRPKGIRGAEARDSEVRPPACPRLEDDSDGSTRNNQTEPAVAPTAPRVAGAAIRRAAAGRVAFPAAPTVHAVRAGGWSHRVIASF